MKALALLLLTFAATAQAAEPVTIQILPGTPLIEEGRSNQLLNFDFLLTNNMMEETSRQLVVVTTPAADAVDGTLQRYARATTHDAWMKVGDPIPVVVGRNGIATDKHEGDGRAPAGIFPIGPAFGFAETAKDLSLPYVTLLPTTECVDDATSSHYNTIVDRARVAAVDWTSSEKMRDVPQYRRGAVVQYNTPPRPGAGSCIFLHIWTGPSHGTAGCTAMSAADLDVLLRWLDPALNPRLAVGVRGQSRF